MTPCYTTSRDLTELRRYELTTEGWEVVGEDFKLLRTTYGCAACGHRPEAGSPLWLRLNDLPNKARILV